VSALHTQRHRGQLPGAFGVFVGRRLLFRRADLDEWIASLVEGQIMARDWVQSQIAAQVTP
jgi:hypothetical protein